MNTRPFRFTPARFLLPPARAALLAFGAVAVLFAAQGATPLRAEDPVRPQKVIIQPGDTLSGIAVRFYGSPEAVQRILAANGLSDPNVILAGTSLLLPSDAAAAAAVAPATTVSSTPVTPGRQVTVGPGETLSAIADREYGSPAYASTIAKANGIDDPDRVMAGMKLMLPAARPPPTAAARTTPAAGPLAGRRICLDPGHGGVIEPGAVFDFGEGRVLREADVVLDIARNLRAWLEADGATVTLTRTTDAYLGLDVRAYLCNAFNADIAVSLHLNGADNPSWNGALALFAKRVDHSLADVVATALQLGLSRNAPGVPFTSFGARSFDGAVLLNTTMPAVIVEPVFLTNPGEARALLAPTSEASSRRNQIVLEVYRGIRMYFASR